MRLSWQANIAGLLSLIFITPYNTQCAVVPQLLVAHPHRYSATGRTPFPRPSTDEIEVSVGAPIISPRDTVPILPLNFPDPSVLRDVDGTWYAFATAGNGRQIQAASAPSASGPWTYLQEVDVLPDPGEWTTRQNTWAPDVRRIAEGRYTMYYSGQRDPVFSDSGEVLAYHYCLGVATATSPLGPYEPADEPWACAEEEGGIIDPSGFLDPATGRRYVVYKIDGNSIGLGGSCGNGELPQVPTPIMLQEVDGDDGITPIGSPVQILDREEQDGPLVEAPSLAWLEDEDGEGIYVLFYSSHCWVEGAYNVNYATADSVFGPFQKSVYNPLIQTGDLGLTAPGGATVVDGDGWLVFHANCDEGRCMFEVDLLVDGIDVIIGEIEE